MKFFEYKVFTQYMSVNMLGLFLKDNLDNVCMHLYM